MLMAIDGLHMRESKMRRVKLTFLMTESLLGAFCTTFVLLSYMLMN